MSADGLQGKVAIITGAARGQGRAHAVALAEAGAKVIATDICAQIETVPYPLGTEEELAETARLVEAAGGECLTAVADVRSREQLVVAVEQGVERFGRLDVAIANAGVAQGMRDPEPTTIDEQWTDYIDVNLTGGWNLVKAVQEPMVAAGNGGSIIIVSSTSGLKGMSRGDARADAYTAAKHGLVGVMRGYATELGPAGIRVNTVHPTAISTVMSTNPSMDRWVEANVDRVAGGFGDAMHKGRIPMADIVNAVMFLASDLSASVTGVAMPVDAGFTIV